MGRSSITYDVYAIRSPDHQIRWTRRWGAGRRAPRKLSSADFAELQWETTDVVTVKLENTIFLEWRDSEHLALGDFDRDWDARHPLPPLSQEALLQQLRDWRLSPEETVRELRRSLVLRQRDARHRYAPKD